MKSILILFTLMAGTFAFCQDTIDVSLLNKRMPLNLNEQIIYLRNITPYTGVTFKKDSAGTLLGYNSFLNGQMHGSQTKFYPTSETKETVHYSFGKIDGLSTLFYKNGTKMSEMKFADGILVDTVKTWHKSGEIKSLSVEDRQNPANGYYCSFYEDGKKEIEIIKGYQTIWYPSGKMKAEVLLKMGRPTGEFIKYKENGKIEIIEIWENGKMIDSYKKKKK